jgi:hypothetical protein
VQSVGDHVFHDTLHLHLSTKSQEHVAGGFLNSGNTLLAQRGHGHQHGAGNGGDHTLDEYTLISAQILRTAGIDLVHGDNQRLVGEERHDRVEELTLLLDTVTALLADIEEINDGASQMSHGSDGLHFNCVSVLQGMIQDTGGIDHLPAEIFVVSVSNKK